MSTENDDETVQIEFTIQKVDINGSGPRPLTEVEQQQMDQLAKQPTVYLDGTKSEE